MPILIAIEGIDGAGKRTYSEMINQGLLDYGYTSKILSFPQYENSKSATLVAKYLNGDFGSALEVVPYFSALLFSLDRLEQKALIFSALENYDALIVDRYVASNLVYAGVKVPESDRAEFFQWLVFVEHELFGLPKPNINILVDVPEKEAQNNVLRKGNRSYTSLATDIHESETSYLKLCRSLYLSLSESDLYGRWKVIMNVEGKITEVGELALNIVLDELKKDKKLND